MLRVLVQYGLPCGRVLSVRVELDMYVRVPGRIHRREVSQMSPRSRDHHLFLHAAGSLCKVCVQAWLDRGADTSYGTPWEPHKSAFAWAEEAQGDEDLLSMLGAPGGNGACSISNLLIVSQLQRWRLSAGMMFPFPTSGRFGADDQGRGAAVASAALRGDLEMLKDIFELNDCTIFIGPGVGVEEANLPDVLEHWTFREYVELAFLRAATGSIRRQNLHSVLLWMDGQESMEAFDFAFGPMKVYDLDVLRTLTLTGKVFQVLSLLEWKSQLRLIDGCYNGHKNLVSELEGRRSR